MKKPSLIPFFLKLQALWLFLLLVQSCTLFKKASFTQRGNGNTVFFDQVEIRISPSNSIQQTTPDPALGVIEDSMGKVYMDDIHQWWSVPYRIGGSTMSGIDCSNFVKGLTNYAYGLNLPRTSREQAAYCSEINKEDLKEGDLVFFNTGRGISHVGLYMANNKFVHASTSMGVIISSLDEPYWKRRYAKSGRMEIRN